MNITGISILEKYEKVLIDNTDLKSNSLQKAIRQLKDLEHYAHFTAGLWATDRPDLVKDKSLFWEINFWDKNNNLVYFEGNKYIELVRYCDKKLVVNFRNGRVFTYLNVPKEIYDNLISAESKGSYLHRHIKGHYKLVTSGAHISPYVDETGDIPKSYIVISKVSPWDANESECVEVKDNKEAHKILNLLEKYFGIPNMHK